MKIIKNEKLYMSLINYSNLPQEIRTQQEMKHEKN
jgi:hypothetical protein